MKIVDRIFSVLDWLLERVNIFMMAFLAISVIVTVFLRYTFNICFIWAEEMIIFIFIATTYFGMIMCVKEDEHIAIDFFKEKFSPFIQRIIDTVITIIGVVTLLCLAYISLKWINTVGGTKSSGLKIEYKYIYIWLPISFVMSAIYEVRKRIGQWYKVSKKVELVGEGTKAWK